MIVPNSGAVPTDRIGRRSCRHFHCAHKLLAHDGKRHQGEEQHVGAGEDREETIGVETPQQPGERPDADQASHPGEPSALAADSRRGIGHSRASTTSNFIERGNNKGAAPRWKPRLDLRLREARRV